MRCHFDTNRFLEIIDWKRREWDVVWSHLPEHTTQIRNVFYNCTDEQPTIVGYCHWFEIPELHNMAADTFDLNLSGILSMSSCGLNSAWLKRLVIKHARQRLSPQRMRALHEILNPQYLGSEAAPDPLTATELPTNTLIWNHRATTYTGHPKMLDELDRLWQQRQDFRLMVTLGAEQSKPYKPYAVENTVNPTDRATYFGTLAGATLGLPRENCQWSVAIQDGFTVGLPYILPRDFCYPEMLPTEYPLFYTDNLCDALNRALDNPATITAAATQAKATAEQTLWDARVTAFADMLDNAQAAAPRIGDRSVKFDQVRELAATGMDKEQIKKAMNWRVSITWTPYRMRLLDEQRATNG
jgi:nuclear transport factor 2 (NTF2) superfamily protein